MALIRTAEPAPPAPAHRRHLAWEIGEGLLAVRDQPMLLTLAVTAALFNLFDSILLAIYVLYLTRTLGVPPALIGVIFALGSAGGLLGALAARAITRRLGLGPALRAGILLASVAEVAIAFARGSPALAVAQVAGAEAALEVGVVLYAINSTSLRQAVVPDRLQGRITATLGLISGGVNPLGALVGGLLAERYGLRPTVLVAGAGTLLAFLWIMRSPIGRLHSTPLTPDP
jgi:MFS family permease